MSPVGPIIAVTSLTVLAAGDTSNSAAFCLFSLANIPVDSERKEAVVTVLSGCPESARLFGGTMGLEFASMVAGLLGALVGGSVAIVTGSEGLLPDLVSMLAEVLLPGS